MHRSTHKWHGFSRPPIAFGGFVLLYTCSAVETDTCSCLKLGKLGLLVTTLVIYCAAAGIDLKPFRD